MAAEQRTHIWNEEDQDRALAVQAGGLAAEIRESAAGVGYDNTLGNAAPQHSECHT